MDWAAVTLRTELWSVTAISSMPWAVHIATSSCGVYSPSSLAAEWICKSIFDMVSLLSGIEVNEL